MSITVVDDNGERGGAALCRAALNRRTGGRGRRRQCDVTWAVGEVFSQPASVTPRLLAITDDGTTISASYRPVNADSGNFLQVTVTYTDLFSAAANDTNTETFLTKYAVEEGGLEGQPPVCS